MKYRAAAILCTLVLTAGALSGCGNDGADTAETENSSQEESVSEEAVSEEEAAAAGFSDGTDEEGNITGETVLDTSKELTGIHHANISIEGYGDIEIELDADTAPITVTNFVKLAQEDFYDGLTFWRIMDGFMMQGGDPLCRAATRWGTEPAERMRTLRVNSRITAWRTISPTPEVRYPWPEPRILTAQAPSSLSYRRTAPSLTGIMQDSAM